MRLKSNHKIYLFLCLFTFSLLFGCANKDSANEKRTNEDNAISSEVNSEDLNSTEAISTGTLVSSLEDGIYLVEFSTDSSMFHVNEVMDKKAELTVKNHIGTLHLVMPSQNIVNLYKGFAKDVTDETMIYPVVEEVTYSDGMSEAVYAFDVEVEVIDKEFQLALIGTHGNWYDHKVIISNPQLKE